MMRETRNNTRNTTNRILATPAAATATPVKPRTAAINAIIKKVTAQFNIVFLLSRTNAEAIAD
jgi:hypothetical protein